MKFTAIALLISLFLILQLTFFSNAAFSEDDEPSTVDGVKLPSKCETCKYLAYELEQRFAETGKTAEILLTSSSIDPKKTKKYRESELRLIETLENLCDRILQYNMHKERTDSRRFAKGQSQTMQTLHGLVQKGVKVELGIPYELWDSPSVEVTTMKQHCEYILEKYEDEIEHWYFDRNENKTPLRKYLCEDRVLKTKKSRQCLYDVDVDAKPKGDSGSIDEKEDQIRSPSSSESATDSVKKTSRKGSKDEEEL